MDGIEGRPVVADAEGEVLGDVSFEQGIKRGIAECEFASNCAVSSFLGEKDGIEVKSRNNGQPDSTAGVVSLLCGHKEAGQQTCCANNQESLHF
jgi:hypothetical protein